MSAKFGNSIPKTEAKSMEKYDRGCGGKGFFSVIWDDWHNTAGVDVKDNVAWKSLQNESELQHLSQPEYGLGISGVSGNLYFVYVYASYTIKHKPTSAISLQ